MSYYEFVTIWRVDAPIEAVWSQIYHARQWPTWWQGVESVVELQPGDERGIGSISRYTWKSRLPYRLTFDSQVVRVEPPFVLEGLASGELAGRGLWQLAQAGSETTARYDWSVQATKRWMQLMAPLMRPAFQWNHNVIMNWGAEGLAKRLGVQVQAEKSA
jgi:hypothetical protein